MISFWLDVFGFGYVLDPVRLVFSKVLMLEYMFAPPFVNLTMPIVPVEPDLPVPEPIIEIPPTWYQQIIETTTYIFRKLFNFQ